LHGVNGKRQVQQQQQLEQYVSNASISSWGFDAWGKWLYYGTRGPAAGIGAELQQGCEQSDGTDQKEEEGELDAVAVTAHPSARIAHVHGDAAQSCLQSDAQSHTVESSTAGIVVFGSDVRLPACHHGKQSSPAHS
jgi:hypothetical protein